MTTTETVDLSRNAVTKRIRQALRRRSGKSWSVSGGSGTAYGWIRIKATAGRDLALAEQMELAELLGLSRPCHFQGEDIPSGHDYYREYIARAEGREPAVTGKAYWD